MKTETEKLIQRATDSLADAQFNAKHERWTVAVNRAYYAVFDCLRALLFYQEIFAKTHKGIHNKFNELYVKTGLFDSIYSEKLKNLELLRETGDYDLDAEIGQKESIFALDVANQFLEATKFFFENL